MAKSKTRSLMEQYEELKRKVEALENAHKILDKSLSNIVKAAEDYNEKYLEVKNQGIPEMTLKSENILPVNAALRHVAAKFTPDTEDRKGKPVQDVPVSNESPEAAPREPGTDDQSASSAQDGAETHESSPEAGVEALYGGDNMGGQQDGTNWEQR